MGKATTMPKIATRCPEPGEPFDSIRVAINPVNVRQTATSAIAEGNAGGIAKLTKANRANARAIAMAILGHSAEIRWFAGSFPNKKLPPASRTAEAGDRSRRRVRAKSPPEFAGLGSAWEESGWVSGTIGFALHHSPLKKS